MSGCGGSSYGDRPDQRQGQGSGMPLLVGREVGRQHFGALVLVHPPDADDVRAVAEPEQLAAGPAGRFGLAHTEAEHDLGALRHAVHPLHEHALGGRVETEGVGVPEGAPEDRQVEGGLVVGRRVEHRRHAHLADGRHGRVVEVRGEGDDVGVRRHDRVDQLGRDRTVVVDPPLPLLPRRQARGEADRPVEAVEVGQAAVRRRMPVHGHAVDVRGPGLEHVGPGDGVERAGRVDLGLPVGQGAQVLRQLAHGRLGAAHDLGAVARGDEGHLRAHGAPTTAATASTVRAAAAPPDSSAARRVPAAVRVDRSRSSVHTRCTAAAM